MDPLLIPFRSKDILKFLRSSIYDTDFCWGAYYASSGLDVIDRFLNLFYVN